MPAYQCPACKEWPTFPDRHKCPPVWEVRIDSTHDDDWREFYARHADEAAEKAGEEYDTGGDYYLVRGNTIEAEVRLKGAAEIERYEISAESIPRYYANPIPSPQTVE